MPSTRIPDRRLEPRKLPKQSRSGATFEAVLEAAAQIFERRGYAAGTTNRIAERAGVSIGSLYQYFPNKDAILVALVHRHLAEGTAALGPHIERLRSGARFDDVLPDIVHAMVAIHARARRTFTACSSRRPSSLQRFARSSMRWKIGWST
jgi:AcrR family transcriptional regulator